MAVRALRQGRKCPSRRAERIPARYDISLPGNQRKLEAATAWPLAEEAGLTLIEMALAFVLNHPAISSAIIGPRTMEHLESQLTAAEVMLDAEVLDRIDELVPPGTQPESGRRRLAEPRARPGGPASRQRPLSAQSFEIWTFAQL